MSLEAIASLIANLPADHAAGLASLMARGNDPSASGSLMDKRQSNFSMSAVIDAYIINLEQAGFVPNANVTISKRDTLSLDSLIEKRSIPSVPLVINLLEQHGFVPTSGANGISSKRNIPDVRSALEKRTLPDVNLVISRLQAYGFVPSGASSNTSNSSISKRDATSDINTVISQLEAYGFNPSDYMQKGYSSFLLSANSSTAVVSANSSTPILSANSSTSALSATTGITCPQDGNMTFNTGNGTYQVLCGADFNGFDLPDVHSDSLAECFEACSAYVPQGDLLSYGPCVGASWMANDGGNNCFLKYNASSSDVNSLIVSGKQIS